MPDFDLDAALARLDAKERENLDSEDFKKKAEEAFDKADVSQTGDLLENEMMEAVKGAIPEDRCRSLELNPSNVKEMMLNFDENKNGKIEKAEFVNFVKYAIASKVNEYFETAGKSTKSAAAKLKKPELTELKSLGMPPQELKTVISCMVYLLGLVPKPNCEWKESQKAMGDTKKILELLASPPAPPEGAATKVQQALGELTKEEVAKKSKAASFVMEFVMASI
jgi:hypothetical protein